MQTNHIGYNNVYRQVKNIGIIDKQLTQLPDISK